MRVGSTLRGSESMLQGPVVASGRAGWHEDSVAPPPSGETASVRQGSGSKETRGGKSHRDCSQLHAGALSCSELPQWEDMRVGQTLRVRGISKLLTS